MKRTYIQTITDKEGEIVAQRELTYNEDEKTYGRVVFQVHLMEEEDSFLQSEFNVTTKVK